MAQILVKDDQLNGKYIAIASMDSPGIIRSGTDPKEVYNEAQQKGYAGPMIVYIPEKDMVQIYYWFDRLITRPEQDPPKGGPL